MGLEGNALRDIRVGRAEVTFEVKPNNKNYSADDVVSKIGNNILCTLVNIFSMHPVADLCNNKSNLFLGEITNELEQTFGFHSIAVGIGDKVRSFFLKKVQKDIFSKIFCTSPYN